MSIYFSLATTLLSGKDKSHGLRCQESVDSHGIDPGFHTVLFRKFYFLCIYNNFTLLSVFKSVSLPWLHNKLKTQPELNVQAQAAESKEKDVKKCKIFM